MRSKDSTSKVINEAGVEGCYEGLEKEGTVVFAALTPDYSGIFTGVIFCVLPLRLSDGAG